MNKTTTHDQLLRFVYKETSGTENQEIKLQALIDNNVFGEILQLEELKKQLDHLVLQPKSRTIEKILAYAAY